MKCKWPKHSIKVNTNWEIKNKTQPYIASKRHTKI